MAGKRSYDDPCGIARALDVLGERWALLVVRELLLGPKRFTDLRSGLRGVSADVLAQRLRELESAGVLRRTSLPPPASTPVYELTERGRELEPVLLALGRWGSREPLPAGERELSVDAFVVALATVFDPARAAGLESVVQLRLQGEPLVAHVHDGRVDLLRGETEAPELTLESDVAGLREVLWRGRPVAEAEAEGTLRVTGSRALLRRFQRLFPAPRPAPRDPPADRMSIRRTPARHQADSPPSGGSDRRK
jgi:DNA-binding HxlR family transcriptional regulator